MNLDKGFINNPAFLIKMKEIKGVRLAFLRILGEFIMTGEGCKYLYSIGVLKFFETCFKFSKSLQESELLWYKEVYWALTNFFMDNSDFILKAGRTTEIFELAYEIGKDNLNMKSLLKEVLIMFSKVIGEIDPSQGMKIISKGTGIVNFFMAVLQDESNYKNDILYPLLLTLYKVLNYGTHIARFSGVNPLAEEFEKIEGFAKLDYILLIANINEEVKEIIEITIHDFNVDEL